MHLNNLIISTTTAQVATIANEGGIASVNAVGQQMTVAWTYK